MAALQWPHYIVRVNSSTRSGGSSDGSKANTIGCFPMIRHGVKPTLSASHAALGAASGLSVRTSRR